jgi:hypothetical protein
LDRKLLRFEDRRLWSARTCPRFESGDMFAALQNIRVNLVGKTGSIFYCMIRGQ